MSDVNVGDTVRQKSGGPMMTVENIDGEWITCIWHKKGSNGDAVLVRQMFPVATLVADVGDPRNR